MKKLLFLAVFLIIIGFLSAGYFLFYSKRVQAETGWLSGYNYRKQLTFNNSGQGENLANFPVLVKLTSANFDFSKAQSTGQDIRFIDSDGTTFLKYEIEKWVANTEAYIWVKVPQIDGSSATDRIYMYYGNASASDGQDIENTWDASYKAVWHLNGTSGSELDATINNNDGTVSATRGVAGKIGSAFSFDGVNNVVDAGNGASLKPASAATMSFWAKSFANANIYSDPINGFLVDRGYTFWKWSNGGSSVYVVDFAQVASSRRYLDLSLALLPLNTWTFVTITFNGATGYLGVYQNGALYASAALPTGDIDYASPGNFKIGNKFNGLIDEVSVSNVARSVSWIKAQYLSTNLAFITFGSQEAAPIPPSPCQSHNVSGYAWSENIGWISFSCKKTPSAWDYGVDIAATTGNFSGYAWAENIGWIDFAPTGPYPSRVSINPLDYPAKIDLQTGQVSGWARALSYGGGWDGWIGLAGGGAQWYGSPFNSCLGDNGYQNTNRCNWGVKLNKTTSDFSGYAWGDAIIGWTSFKGVAANGSPYGVTTTLFSNQPPDALISCDASLCSGGTCNITTWIAFQPLADPTPCIYTIKNNSTDPDNDIAASKWYLNDIEKSTCPGVCDYTLQSDVAPGSYTVKLRAEDTKGLFDEAIHSLIIKSEVRAGFMCSLDNINWQACGALSNKISQGELFYLKDDPSLAEYSVASQGAAITSRQWEINGTVFGGSSTNPSVNLTLTSNTIRLIVTDSAGRSDYAEHIIGASLSLPEWKEISPF